jgi:hypothetical protein
MTFKDSVRTAQKTHYSVIKSSKVTACMEIIAVSSEIQIKHKVEFAHDKLLYTVNNGLLLKPLDLIKNWVGHGDGMRRVRREKYNASAEI